MLGLFLSSPAASSARSADRHRGPKTAFRAWFTPWGGTSFPRDPLGSAALTPLLGIRFYPFVATVALAGFNPGDVAVMRIWPGLAVDCTIARHMPLNAFRRLAL